MKPEVFGKKQVTISDSSAVHCNLTDFNSGLRELKPEVLGKKQVTISDSSAVHCNLTDFNSGQKEDTKNGIDNPQLREVQLYPSDRNPESNTLVLGISINEVTVNAVIDTAAQVTLMSEEFAKKLKPPVIFKGSLMLKGAGKDNSITARYTECVTVKVGKTDTKWKIIVAKINDQVILGLDFLKHLDAVIDLTDLSITIRGEKHFINEVKSENSSFKICRITLEETLIVPPNSTVRLPVRLAEEFKNEVAIQPSKSLNGLIMPNILTKADSRVPIILNNLTDKSISLKKNRFIGTAMEICGVIDEERCDYEDRASVRSVNTVERELRDLRNEWDEMYSNFPVQLKPLLDSSKENLDLSENLRLASLLLDFKDTFSKHDLDIGHYTKVKHRIDTGNSAPVRERMRRTPLGLEEEEEKHLKDLLNRGVIQPSSSEWSAAPVLVRKKDGKIRYCIDYRKLNSITRKDAFPIPRIETCIDTLRGSKFMSCLDMASGYYQAEIHEDDRHKTAFITKYGLFEHIRLSFGLCNSPAFFQRMIELILTGLTWKICLAYIDDVIVLGEDFEDHLVNLRTVLERFRENNLKLKPQKCKFFQKEVIFLGKLVNEKGIAVNPSSREVILNWPVPLTKKAVESFLGFTNYHREHIKRFATLAEPLYALTKKKVIFQWEKQHQIAFESLQQALVNSVTLAYPDPKEKFILDTDASHTTIGAELLQVIGGKEYVICYASRVLAPAQRKYCTTRKELLAIVVFTRQFRNYLLGQQFIIRTDHNSLTWLLRFKMIEGQLARWLEELSQYDMVIQHRAGKLHTNADGLSRRPDDLDSCNCYYAGADIKLLPCGGCSYCTRAQKVWSSFEDDVDYVVPLSVRSVSEQEEDLDETNLDSLVNCNWISESEITNMGAEQRKDQELNRLIVWLEDKKEPEEHELYLCSPSIKHLWNCKHQLVLKDGILCYKWLDPVHSRLLLVVPRSLRHKILENCHDTKLSGHFGQAKTIERLKQNYIWYGLREDARNYVKSCHTCNVNKKANVKPKGPLGQFHAGIPMEKLHMDILGPLHESSSANKYVLVLVDQFTKWMEMFPLPNQNTITVAKTLLDGFISRLGCPVQIHTDQGKNFDGHLFHDICRLLQIVKTRTTPCRP